LKRQIHQRKNQRSRGGGASTHASLWLEKSGDLKYEVEKVVEMGTIGTQMIQPDLLSGQILQLTWIRLFKLSTFLRWNPRVWTSAGIDETSLSACKAHV